MRAYSRMIAAGSVGADDEDIERAAAVAASAG